MQAAADRVREGRAARWVAEGRALQVHLAAARTNRRAGYYLWQDGEGYTRISWLDCGSGVNIYALPTDGQGHIGFSTRGRAKSALKRTIRQRLRLARLQTEEDQP